MAAAFWFGVGCPRHWQDCSQNRFRTLYEPFERHRRSSSSDWQSTMDHHGECGFRLEWLWHNARQLPDLSQSRHDQSGLRNNVAGVNPNAGFNAVDPNFRPPESYQWNLTISHQLLKDTVLEASYIGNHGLHIWRRNVNRNDIAPNQACRGARCDGSNRDARLADLACSTRRNQHSNVDLAGELIADNRSFLRRRQHHDRRVKR